MTLPLQGCSFHLLQADVPLYSHHVILYICVFRYFSVIYKAYQGHKKLGNLAWVAVTVLL